MNTKIHIEAEGGLRNNSEKEAIEEYVNIFNNSSEDTHEKLHNFIKYIRRQDLTKVLARYEIFKKILTVKGSIIECGVFHGSGLMSWALFSDMIEPINLTRRIYGFDSFEGFPSVDQKDLNQYRDPLKGDLYANVYDELQAIIKTYDKNRFMGHVDKVRIIKGDATKTIPKFIQENQHLVVSLLFLDFDLYEPTKIALDNFLSRMPKGAILAFDELDNPIWPGETRALLEGYGINNFRLERMDFDPYIGFAVLD